MSSIAVVICTRDRPALLERALAAVRRELVPGLELVVVDQGRSPRAGEEGMRVLADRGGRGLSRARNLAARATDAAWLAFVDDDCRPLPGWGRALLDAAAAAEPDVAVLCPHVGAGPLPGGEYLEVTTFPVERAAVRRGRRTHPGLLGFGACTVVRRDVALALGGWDERLGPGVRAFPAADDMDFNYRVLRAGWAARTVPAARVEHDQWRAARDLPALHRGYLAAWSGFACKHLRSGDVAGGLWLLAIGAIDVADMVASALRRRSWLRARIAAAKAAGFVAGTARGLSRAW